MFWLLAQEIGEIISCCLKWQRVYSDNNQTSRVIAYSEGTPIIGLLSKAMSLVKPPASYNWYYNPFKTKFNDWIDIYNTWASSFVPQKSVLIHKLQKARSTSQSQRGTRRQIKIATAKNRPQLRKTSRHNFSNVKNPFMHCAQAGWNNMRFFLKFYRNGDRDDTVECRSLVTDPKQEVKTTEIKCPQVPVTRK